MESINIYSGDEAISRVVFGRPGAGMEEDFSEIWECIPSGANVYAVVDRNASAGSPFVSGLAGFLEARGVPVYMINATEEEKTMDTVLGICSWLMDCGADRKAFVLAAGGGITTDMAGFAASIYKRGVRFAFVPTTLLAQVDAAIGGKTGVNFDRYKNMLGVIRQPEFTFLTARVLESLPQRDFLSGVAEMLKTFIIEDNGNFDKAVRQISSGLRQGELAGLIAAAAKVKAGVVSRDAFESGERRKLNLGHTFAHAVEWCCRSSMPGQFDFTHGEAVAIGVGLAARLSVRLGEAPEGMEKRVVSALKACGLPTDCPYSLEDMAGAMTKDKKAEGGKVHFVLMHEIGDVFIRDLSVAEALTVLQNANN